MQVRIAIAEDIPQIMQLINAVVPLMIATGNFQWDSNYPDAKVFAKDISLNQLWVAEDNNNIAGVAAITTEQDAEYADVGWDINELAVVVHRLAVNPKYQGRGVAAQLMLQAEVVAAGMGTSILRIDTNKANKATQRLFPKLGYVFSGEIGLAFRPGLRFLCYEKRLDDTKQTRKSSS